MNVANFSRRVFSRQVLTTAVLGALAVIANPSLAQGQKPAEQVREIKPARKVDDPKKIEVIEFFWYGCPHCSALEPYVQEWLKKIPADVSFRKIHVDFQEVKHQQLFFTLEALGREKELSPKVFYRIHGEKDRLDTADKMADFLVQFGVDKKQFIETFNSFGVKNSMTRGTAAMKAFGVDGVPAFAINGKYYTSPSMVGGNAQTFTMIEKLIAQERALRK